MSDNNINIQEEYPSQTSLRSTVQFKTKNSSVTSVDHHLIESESDDSLDNKLDNTTSNSPRNITINERPCSLTQMLLVYAQQELETLTNPKLSQLDHNLSNILNVLELHFNTYADDKRHIYFEGIFQILYNFKEQITEFILIETMQLLDIDPVAPCNYENFILIICHLPPLKQDYHMFLDVFNELDYNKDSYITFDDIQLALPHLTSHFNEEIIHAAIHTIDTDHDNDHLSYFDFVTSLIALQECKSAMKTKTSISKSLRMMTEQKKNQS